MALAQSDVWKTDRKDWVEIEIPARDPVRDRDFPGLWLNEYFFGPEINADTGDPIGPKVHLVPREVAKELDYRMRLHFDSLRRLNSERRDEIARRAAASNYNARARGAPIPAEMMSHGQDRIDAQRKRELEREAKRQ